ncbi:MAG: LysR family transcriptional regulator [Rivihabitans pingtungensis]
MHFGRAAERLCMSQPPLSQAIQQLEDALGVAVFERHSRKVALTPAGQALLAPARQLLADLHAAIGAAQAAARGERGLLRVAYVGSAVFSVLPAIVARFHADFPEVELQLQEAPPDAQLAGCAAASWTLAWCARPVRKPGCAAMCCWTNPPGWRCPAAILLPGAEALSLAELPGAPFITIDAADGGHMLELYRRAIFSRALSSTCATCTPALPWGRRPGPLVHPPPASRQPRPGVACRPTLDAPQLDLCLLTPDPARSPIVEHFRRVAQAVVAQMVE